MQGFFAGQDSAAKSKRFGAGGGNRGERARGKGKRISLAKKAARRISRR